MEHCSKVCYPNRGAALNAMRAIQRKKSANGLKSPQGAYLCAACRRWHLTSKPGIQTPPWARKRHAC
jgi:hypothetical protein